MGDYRSNRVLEDQHSDETLVPEDYDEMKLQYRRLAIRIATLKLGDYTEQAQKDVEEYFRLRKILKGF